VSERTSHVTFQHGQEFLAAISERWNYQILREVFFGVGRFGELKRALGISANILTARLNSLTELGLLTKHAYRPDKPWYEYQLTDSARELVVPAIVTITRWAEANAADGVQQLPSAGRGFCPAAGARRGGTSLITPDVA
jgi:DNA-binding HxlR family transcriptional regulator